MKKIVVFLLFTLFSFGQNPNRKYVSHSFKNNQLKIIVSDGFYVLKPISNQIIETSFVPKSEKLITQSEAVVYKNPNFKFNFVETNTSLSVVTNNIKAVVQKNNFQITYLNQNNQNIVSEKLGYFKQKHLAPENVKGNIIADSTQVIQFNISPDEVLYGGGARVLGMNRRGNKLALYNRAQYGYENRAELMNYTLPIVISSNKYLIHFDNAPIGYLDLDSQKNNTLAYETISGRKTYQVIIGNTFEELTSNYTQLTGFQPLPPRWALGNFSSRFGYHSEAEARKTIQKFKDEKIPVDAIILDLYWFGKDIKGTMGNLEIFKDSFPNFDKMVSDFNKMGVKTVTITEPFVLTTSKKWQETVNLKLLATNADGTPAKFDFYFGNTGIIDVFKPEAKKWFWNIYKNLVNKGVSGVWGDLGEPEVFPSTAKTTGGTADEVHNIYGHNWAKLIAEGYQKDFPTTRPFILMRAGAAGSQRFGMIPWSGDVNRTWGGLSGQVELALQMGMQGLGYMHSDLGGFAGANLDDELYVRWLQYGVFTPIFRPHAQEEVASEPVFRSDYAKNLAKKAIELRYQMLPYNYTLAFENSISGKPLMRPLFFEDDKPELLTKSDGYFWGNHFLIYPIIEKDQQIKAIYFPKNSNWFNFYTDEKQVGGTTTNAVLNKENIPTYVKGGSFIPLIKNLQNTNNYVLDNFEVHFYFDEDCKNSSYNLYNDDGLTPNNYINKKYEKFDFRSKNKNNQLEIKVEFDYTYNSTKTKKIKLIVHGFNKKPKEIKLNKTIISEKDYFIENNLISFNLTCPIDVTNNLEIQY